MMKKQFAVLAGLVCLMFLCGYSFDLSPASEAEETVNRGREDESSSEAEEYTTQAYVFSAEGNTMYVDMENPNHRIYPGEAEECKVALDISNAEVIQSDPSDGDPETAHPVKEGVIVSIDYHIENGKYIADKITTDGMEHFHIVYTSKGTITHVSETEIIVSVTEGDYEGETLEFKLTEWDPDGEVLTDGDSVSLEYYRKNGDCYIMSIAVE